MKEEGGGPVGVPPPESGSRLNCDLRVYAVYWSANLGATSFLATDSTIQAYWCLETM